MFIPRLIQLVFILIAMSELSRPSHPSAPPALAAHLEMVAGQVVVWEPALAIWVPAEVGQAITQGARVRTGAEARAVLYLPDGRIVRLAPNSTFSLNVPNAGVRDTPAGVASVRG